VAFGPRLYEEIKHTLPLATDGNGNATEFSFGDLPFNFVAKLFTGDGTLETKTDIVGTEYVVSNGYYNETTQCYYIGK
jgi:hypothetical protein